MGRRRVQGTVIALAGLAALVIAAPVLRDMALRGTQAGPVEAKTMDRAGEAAVSGQAAPAAARTVARPVAPQKIAPPPAGHHMLERIEAREPLSEIGRAHVPSEGPPKETMLHRPLVTRAGAFEAMGYRIVLPGLLPAPEDQMCGEGGTAWPCGIHARTAFRNWLRGRALACVVPTAPPAEPVTTPCRLGKLDAGAWLVEQGWALADPADDRYAALAEEARKAGRGLHGAGPAGLAPLSVTVPPATDGVPPPADPAAGPSGD